MLPAAMSGPAMAATEVLAQQQDTGGQGQDFGKSSPVGLLLMLVFLIAVVFLVRSMTKHLKRVPANFGDADDGSGAQPGGDDSASDGPAPDGSHGSGSHGSVSDGDAASDSDAAGESEAVPAAPGDKAKTDES